MDLWRSARQYIIRWVVGVVGVMGAFSLLSTVTPGSSHRYAWQWLAAMLAAVAATGFYLFHRVRQQRDALRVLPLIVRERDWVRELLIDYRDIASDAEYTEWEGGLRGAGGCLHQIETSFADEIERVLGPKWARSFRSLGARPLGPPDPGYRAETGFPYKLAQAADALDALLAELRGIDEGAGHAVG